MNRSTSRNPQGECVNGSYSKAVPCACCPLWSCFHTGQGPRREPSTERTSRVQRVYPSFNIAAYLLSGLMVIAAGNCSGNQCARSEIRQEFGCRKRDKSRISVLGNGDKKTEHTNLWVFV